MADPSKPGVQGEGDYISAKRFDDEERSFVESGQVDKKAREAAEAVDGPEGPELEAARKASAEGRSLGKDEAKGADKGSSTTPR